MTDYKILYKFASRSRPLKFMESLDNIISLSESGSYLIHASLDLDDDTMCNISVREVMDQADNIEYVYGDSTGKINAINRDMDAIEYPWDICVVMSDDMKFTMRGFDNEIRRAFDEYFPDLDGYVHFHDGPYAERLSGLNIQGRKFFDRFGYLYNPEYISLWCDNEIMEVSKQLNRYVYMGNHLRIVEHLHPCHVPGLEYDDLLRKTESYYAQDEKTYKARKARNFDL